LIFIKQPSHSKRMRFGAFRVVESSKDIFFVSRRYQSQRSES